MSKKGFTLIELLVVISIIGLLSSLVLASLNSTRAKSRDVKRMQDVRQIQLALELYYNKHGVYPNSGWVSSAEAGWTSILGVAMSEFLPTMPKDPLNTNSIAPGYAYNGNINYSYDCVGNVRNYGGTDGYIITVAENCR